MDQKAGNRRIYLVGMMGSGKSFWLGKLGHFYGLPAYDLDRLIETAAGKPIKDIFAEAGEPAFREMESAMLQKGIPGNDYILACGGGTPCFFDNMDYMKRNGVVVWLNPSIDELVKRLSRGIDTRPVLEGIQSAGALAEHLKQLMLKRLYWYQQAHIVVDEDTSLGNITKMLHAFDGTS
jgi:shikimate kinase